MGQNFNKLEIQNSITMKLPKNTGFAETKNNATPPGDITLSI